MTFDPTTDRWHDVTDADVRWLATQGYNAREVAAIAHTTRQVAEIWMEAVFVKWAAS